MEDTTEIKFVTVRLADLVVEIQRDVLLRIPYFEALIKRWNGCDDTTIVANEISFNAFAVALEKLTGNELEITESLAEKLAYLGFEIPKPEPVPIPIRQNVCSTHLPEIVQYTTTKLVDGVTEKVFESITKPLLYLTSGKLQKFMLICNGNYMYETNAELNKLLLELNGVETVPDDRYTPIYLPDAITDIMSQDTPFAIKTMQITLSDVTTDDCVLLFKDRLNPTKLLTGLTEYDRFTHTRVKPLRLGYSTQGDCHMNYAGCEQYVEQPLDNGTCKLFASPIISGLIIVSDNEIESISVLREHDNEPVFIVDGFTARN